MSLNHLLYYPLDDKKLVETISPLEFYATYDYG